MTHAVDGSRARTLGQLTAILIVALALRSYDIGRQSLWVDELFSRYYFPELFNLSFLWTKGFLYESSPPLFYLLIGGWTQVFGTGEAAMRSLSLIASVVAIPVVYLLGKELLGRRCAILAALIFALEPVQINFAQEARTYALLLIPLGVALLMIARFLHGETRASTLLLYGLSVVVALYCHSTALFFIAACNLVVFAALIGGPADARGSALLRWSIANAVVAALAAPQVAVILMQGRSGAGIDWIPPFEPIHVIRALNPIIVGIETPNRFPGAQIAAAFLACLGAGLLMTRTPKRVWLVLVAIPVTFIVLVALGSLHRSIFITRVFVWVGIPLALLLAHALSTAWMLRWVLAGLAVIACATGTFYLHAAPQKEPWREIFHSIGPQLARADHLVLTLRTNPTAFAYYAPYLTRLEVWGQAPRNHIENGEMPDRMGVHRIPREQLVEWIRSGANVWLLVRMPDQPKVDALLNDVPPPRERLEWQCGKVVCVSAFSWSASKD